MSRMAMGVDTHKETLAACLVDGLGIARDERGSATTRPATRRSWPGWRGRRAESGSGSRAPRRTGPRSPGPVAGDSTSSRFRRSSAGESDPNPPSRQERSR